MESPLHMIHCCTEGPAGGLEQSGRWAGWQGAGAAGSCVPVLLRGCTGMARPQSAAPQNI